MNNAEAKGARRRRMGGAYAYLPRRSTNRSSMISHTFCKRSTRTIFLAVASTSTSRTRTSRSGRSRPLQLVLTGGVCRFCGPGQPCGVAPFGLLAPTPLQLCLTLGLPLSTRVFAIAAPLLGPRRFVASIQPHRFSPLLSGNRQRRLNPLFRHEFAIRLECRAPCFDRLSPTIWMGPPGLMQGGGSGPLHTASERRAILFQLGRVLGNRRWMVIIFRWGSNKGSG
mmetsp:Transcript_24452/g.78916  ORF Transcript_24452/g.78916 Transcript_24452/m.78916 type:complete len:225 (-) Transcript_24452:315-989(-)